MIHGNFIRKAFWGSLFLFFASIVMLAQGLNVFLSYMLSPVDIDEIKNSNKNYRHIEIVEYEVLGVLEDDSPGTSIFIIKVNDDILLVKSHKDRESYSELNQMLSGQHSSNSYIIDGYFKMNSKDYIHQIDNKLVSQRNISNAKIYKDFSIVIFADDYRFIGNTKLGVFSFVLGIIIMCINVVFIRIKYPYNSIFEIIRKSLWPLK